MPNIDLAVGRLLAQLLEPVHVPLPDARRGDASVRSSRRPSPPSPCPRFLLAGAAQSGEAVRLYSVCQVLTVLLRSSAPVRPKSCSSCFSSSLVRVGVALRGWRRRLSRLRRRRWASCPPACPPGLPSCRRHRRHRGRRGRVAVAAVAAVSGVGPPGRARPPASRRRRHRPLPPRRAWSFRPASSSAGAPYRRPSGRARPASGGRPGGGSVQLSHLHVGPGRRRFRRARSTATAPPRPSAPRWRPRRRRTGPRAAGRSATPAPGTAAPPASAARGQRRPVTRSRSRALLYHAVRATAAVYSGSAVAALASSSACCVLVLERRGRARPWLVLRSS